MQRPIGVRKSIINSVRLAILVLGLSAVLGCIPGDDGNRLGLPSQGTPPAQLASLPVHAETKCYESWKGTWVRIGIWELPGVKPGDSNSAYMGNRGDLLGSLPACTAVTVTDYAWSETDREFWLYIGGPDGEKGWVPLGLVDL